MLCRWNLHSENPHKNPHCQPPASSKIPQSTAQASHHHRFSKGLSLATPKAGFEPGGTVPQDKPRCSCQPGVGVPAIPKSRATCWHCRTSWPTKTEQVCESQGAAVLRAEHQHHPGSRSAAAVRQNFLDRLLAFVLTILRSEKNKSMSM